MLYDYAFIHVICIKTMKRNYWMLSDLVKPLDHIVCLLLHFTQKPSCPLIIFN